MTASYSDSVFGLLEMPDRRPRRYTLTCEIPSWIFICADTYEEALARLFKRWKPSEAPKEIEGT